MAEQTLAIQNLTEKYEAVFTPRLYDNCVTAFKLAVVNADPDADSVRFKEHTNTMLGKVMIREFVRLEGFEPSTESDGSITARVVSSSPKQATIIFQEKQRQFLLDLLYEVKESIKDRFYMRSVEAFEIPHPVNPELNARVFCHLDTFCTENGYEMQKHVFDFMGTTQPRAQIHVKPKDWESSIVGFAREKAEWMKTKKDAAREEDGFNVIL